jgi:hypothetical protein
MNISNLFRRSRKRRSRRRRRRFGAMRKPYALNSDNIKINNKCTNQIMDNDYYYIHPYNLSATDVKKSFPY